MVLLNERGNNMRKSTQEQIEWDLQCYGYTEAELRANLDHDLSAKLSGSYLMTALSFLSNAQEEIEAGYNEGARKTINIAKFVLMNYVAKEA